jgi:hypothetical protein
MEIRSNEYSFAALRQELNIQRKAIRAEVTKRSKAEFGQLQEKQEEIWIANGELARSPDHPFYQRLNDLLDSGKFDLFVEGLCLKFYAPRMGRPSLAGGWWFAEGQAGGGGCDDAGGLGGNALDKRKKRTSNKEWMSPTDRDARIRKMKDGRTHLAHKAEQAVDLDTGAVVAVTLREADKGDTTTLDRTLCEAGETVAELAGREAESVRTRSRRLAETFIA